MTDVRSMLRAERASRRITHPHASYTATGNLLCNLCEVPIKSEKAWSAHLHSTQHSLRSGRQKDATESRPTDTSASKKRKAVEFEEPPPIDRKKAKPASTPSNKYPTPEQDDDHESDDNDDDETAAQVPANESLDTRFEAEPADLEALERDLAALEQEAKADDQRSALTAITAAATISADAVAAGQEKADEESRDTAKQRSKRDIENENDREDAARALEEEFQEMEQLQERVKKLRDRREALRSRSGTSTEFGDRAPSQPLVPMQESIDQQEERHSERAESDTDSSEESDYDGWTYGAG